VLLDLEAIPHIKTVAQALIRALHDGDGLQRLDEFGREEVYLRDRQTESRQIPGIRAEEQIRVLLVMTQPYVPELGHRVDQIRGPGGFIEGILTGVVSVGYTIGRLFHGSLLVQS